MPMFHLHLAISVIQEINNGGTADEFYRFKFSHAGFSFKRQHVASKKLPPDGEHQACSCLH